MPMRVFPDCHTDTDRVIKRRHHLFPAAHPVENALSVALLNVGPIIHSVLFLLNTGAIEHFAAWDFYNEGTTPSVGIYCDGPLEIDAEPTKRKEMP